MGFLAIGGSASNASWLIDMRQLLASAHPETGCQECHEDIENADLHPNPADVTKKMMDFFDIDECLLCHDEVMEKLDGEPAPGTVYAVSTVQEEIGLRGARTSSYKVAPDAGINLESGIAGDYPGISQDEAQERIGEGPAIFLHDSSMLPNLKLRDLAIDVAKENGIPLQFNVLSGYGEDGAEIQKSHGGVPTINITVRPDIFTAIIP